MGRKSLFIALALFLWSNVAFAQSPLAGEYVEGEVLVVLEGTGINTSDVSAFKAGLDSSANALASSVGAKSVGTYSAIAAQSGKNIAHFRAEGKTTAELMEELKAQPGVVGVAPNYVFNASVIPNDPYYASGDLWGMNRIDGPSAWDISSGDRGVFVAVLDTGIKNDHVDLVANIGTDKDGNWGKNLITVGALPADDNGHGTHVAGTIGAMGNNSVGVVGVNWNVSLLSVKVLDSQGSGTGAQIMAGLDYVVAQRKRGLNIKVANMSLGGWGSPIYNVNADPYALAFKAVSDADILLVVAAGNEGQDLDNPGWYDHPTQGWINLAGQRPYPACFPFANMITVGSITPTTFAMSDFSNYSPNFVQLAAPGSGIWSTSDTGGYESMNGTSMATPHVAGAAALVAAVSPAASAREIKARILSNINVNANVSSRFYTKGDLNLLKAVRNDVGYVPATGIAVSTPSVSLDGGNTFQLTATVSPANATNKMVGWSSSNPAVATVSGTGLVRAVSGGTAVISAWSNDGGLLSNTTVSVTGSSSDSGGGCTIGLAPATILLALPLLFLRR
nr:S8 family serine peptidase [uncultured Dethiosulfovibrio sp.]